jgi:hypothetical protein
MRSLFFAGLVAFASSACSSETSGPPCDTADKYEPNESANAAKDLGGFTDDPDSSLKVDLTVHLTSDVDFFKFNVADKGLGGDPIITISAPEGYEITTWFTCTRGSPKTFSCIRGKEVDEPSVIAGKGCQNEQPSGSVSSTTDCDADENDDGTVIMRVKKLDTSNTCSSKFDITIEVE